MRGDVSLRRYGLCRPVAQYTWGVRSSSARFGLLSLWKVRYGTIYYCLYFISSLSVHASKDFPCANIPLFSCSMHLSVGGLHRNIGVVGAKPQNYSGVSN